MTLYKYLSPERIDVLSEGRIRFTPFFEMNDPFEFSFALNAHSNEKFDAETDNFLFERAEAAQFMRSEFGTCGILCLSKRRDSKLMWSHYADNHRGFIIGFNPEHSFFNQETFLISPVLGKIHVSGAGFSFPRAIEYMTSPPRISMGQDTINILFKKAKCWQYEEEVRVLRNIVSSSFRPTKNIDLFVFPPDAVNEIVIGIGTSSLLQSKILELSKEKYTSAKVEYAEIDSRNYEMSFSKENSEINRIWRTFFQ